MRNLFLIRVADANNGLFYFIRGVLVHLKPSLGRGEHRHRPRVPQLQRASGIAVHKGFLNGGDRRLKLRQNIAQSTEQGRQPRRQIPGLGVDSAAGDVNQFAALAPFNHAPAHVPQARIYAYDAHMCVTFATTSERASTKREHPTRKTGKAVRFRHEISRYRPIPNAHNCYEFPAFVARAQGPYMRLTT